MPPENDQGRRRNRTRRARSHSARSAAIPVARGRPATPARRRRSRPPRPGRTTGSSAQRSQSAACQASALRPGPRRPPSSGAVHAPDGIADRVASKHHLPASALHPTLRPGYMSPASRTAASTIAASAIATANAARVIARASRVGRRKYNSAAAPASPRHSRRISARASGTSTIRNVGLRRGVSRPSGRPLWGGVARTPATSPGGLPESSRSSLPRRLSSQPDQDCRSSLGPVFPPVLPAPKQSSVPDGPDEWATGHRFRSASRSGFGSGAGVRRDGARSPENHRSGSTARLGGSRAHPRAVRRISWRLTPRCAVRLGKRTGTCRPAPRRRRRAQRRPPASG
jgi:hypothetical protein